MNRIIIIGYMGSGKTTVGNALSKDLGLPFYDLDWYIETRMHATVKQLFDQRGQDGFRRIEHNMLHEVAEFENIVLSCGGGTPCHFDNMDYLNTVSQTCYLQASHDTILQHLSMSRGERPLLKGKTPEELRTFVTEQLAERRPFYEKARHTIEVDVLDSFDKIQLVTDQIKQTLSL